MSASMWRAGVSDTCILIDQLRSRYQSKMKRSKHFQDFDQELNNLLQNWFDYTRKESPKTYQETQELRQVFIPENSIKI